jgi:transposase InsO family protein
MGTNQDQASGNGNNTGRHHPFRNNNNNTNRNFNNNNSNSTNNNNNNNNFRSQNKRWINNGNGESKDDNSSAQSKLNVLTGSNSIHVNPKAHLTLNALSLSTSDPPSQPDENPTTDLALESIAHLSDSIFTDEEEDTRTPEEIEIDNDLQYLDSIFDKINIHNVVTDNLETITYSAMTVSDAQNRRIIVPLEFNNTVYDALLDTGASKSFIDRNIVEQSNLQIKPAIGKVRLGDKNKFGDRIGETEPIEIRCNEHSILSGLEVFDLEFSFIIGMDIFHELGFSIGGISDGRENAERLPQPIPDEKPSLLPLTKPEEELTPQFIAEQKAFMKYIDEVLKGNADIPRNSYCPVSEMKVYLPVPKGTTIFRKPRPFAEQQMHIFDDQVAKWLEDEVITLAPPGNPHNNTLTLASKKDLNGQKTKFRVCLDPRPLNQVLPDDNHPVPLISDIIQQLGGHAIYSTIDLTQAYHRLPVHPNHQSLTAFMHRGTQYMFQRAPFGLKPLTSLFQRGMSRILGDLSFVLVFVDDIVVFSKNREEHAEHVKCVIQRLTEAKLIINTEKSHFFATQIVLLGFVIDLHGQRIDPTKLVNILEWDAPTTGLQIQSFLGTCNFFRNHIPVFSTLSAPLDTLRNATKPFTLNKEQLDSFEALKDLLTVAPILHFVDWTKPLYAGTDASNYGVGATLYQIIFNPKTNKDEVVFISFMARSLQARERRYSATQKELLAIVFALKKFHYYLWDRHFTLYTDHRALTFIHTQKDMNSMLTNWQETILDYNFTVKYRPGVLNILPDALSRLFPADFKSRYPRRDEQNISLSYMQTEESYKVITNKAERDAILDKVHTLGHFGTNVMVKNIHADHVTWPHLTEDCLAWVKKCPECQRNNIAQKGYHPLKAIHAQLPGEHMAVDLAGPFPLSDKGNKYLLILVDVCTRFVFLKAIPNKNSLTVGGVLFDIFSLIGFPRILQSDNGTEFVNALMTTIKTEMGTDHRLTTPYHPRGNGVAERHVKIACDILRKEFKQQGNAWDAHVPMAQLAMNTRIVALHNSSPFSLFFARKFNGFHNFSNDKDELLTQKELCDRLKYMTEIVFPAITQKAKLTQKKMIERFNATVLHNDFPDGAKVMTLDPIKGDKLTPRYEGPFTVVRRTTGGSYELRDGTGSLLGRNYAPSQLKLVLEDFEESPTYEVEKIIHHKAHPAEPGKWLYRTKWRGYSDKECTWEPEENFVEKQCIREYWNKLGTNAETAAQERVATKLSKRNAPRNNGRPPRKSKRIKHNAG